MRTKCVRRQLPSTGGGADPFLCFPRAGDGLGWQHQVISATDVAARFDRLSQQLADRIRAVPEGAWDNPSPCEGWTARDVVAHLVEWIPGYLGAHGVPTPDLPPVADDPLGAWTAVADVVRSALADPATAERPVETPYFTRPLAEIVDMIVTSDVMVHGWDLARATGQDEVLDPEMVQRMLASVGSMPEEAMQAGGMFGPRVEVPEGADDQTKLLALLGRRA